MKGFTLIELIIVVAVVFFAVLIVGTCGCNISKEHPEGIVFIDKDSGLPSAFMNDITYAEDEFMGGTVNWKGDTRDRFEREFCKWNSAGPYAFTDWYLIETRTSLIWKKSDEYKEFTDYIAELCQREGCS